MSDVYEPPKANLIEEPTGEYDSSDYGSIEKGIAGEYDFDIGQVLSEAWEKSKGAKGTILLALVFFLVIQFVVSIGLTFLFQALELGVIGQLINQLLLMLIVTPLNAGIFIIGLRRTVDAPIQAGDLFNYYHMMTKLFLASVLMTILVLVGFVLLIIPGFYLSISYALVIPLIADKNLGIWEAMEVSRKAVTKKWFIFFLFFIVIGLINFLAILPIFIGLIWTVPMSVIAMGVIYRNVFGFEQATVE